MIASLGTPHVESLRELLLQDIPSNLFLIGFLATQGITNLPWLGMLDGGVQAVALVIPGRLVVPFAPDPEHAAAIGRWMRGRYPASMLIGPREACDALWKGWTRGHTPPLRCYNQRLYSIDTPTTGPAVPGFRRAVASDWETIATFSAAMEAEDLGRDPRETERGLHDRVVRDRIERGATWVIERDGELVFTLNVGTVCEQGCQVGGTYVPPSHRGKGIATEGMHAMVRHLLTEAPRVTLHVNEANIPAVRAYERVGFAPVRPFRLITV